MIVDADDAEGGGDLDAETLGRDDGADRDFIAYPDDRRGAASRVAEQVGGGGIAAGECHLGVGVPDELR